eukprot:TRINITY_DN20973_c0_g1_i5.p2 TRINITY_DN20973_c0_g1~~TRINITY_DN20973_c0_g1_i5.p2  ORF type:complete len:124 (-),score=19.05 TRINITY_DN20973_c0_g1_i5:306-677(-)
MRPAQYFPTQTIWNYQGNSTDFGDFQSLVVLEHSVENQCEPQVGHLLMNPLPRSERALLGDIIAAGRERMGFGMADQSGPQSCCTLGSPKRFIISGNSKRNPLFFVFFKTALSVILSSISGFV